MTSQQDNQPPDVKAGQLLDSYPVRNLMGGSLSPAQLEKLLCYESLHNLVESLEALGWSGEEEVLMLVQMARYGESQQVRLKALKQLQDRRQEMMKNNGLIVQASESRTLPGGGHATLNTSVVGMALQRFNAPSRPDEEGVNEDGESEEEKEQRGHEQRPRSSDGLVYARQPNKRGLLPGLAGGEGLSAG